MLRIYRRWVMIITGTARLIRVSKISIGFDAFLLAREDMHDIRIRFGTECGLYGFSVCGSYAPTTG